MHIEDMMRIQNADYLEKVFAMAEKLQSLNLSTDETCVLGAATLMFTGNICVKIYVYQFFHYRFVNSIKLWAFKRQIGL